VSVTESQHRAALRAPASRGTGAPVFVDPTGRRRRRLHALVWVVTVLATAYLLLGALVLVAPGTPGG